ncbi:DUF3592 domain-containing protein [Candidatus Nanohalococcus occultus]|uniref:DUF3592 domain-containing protein n=1 Tax=Candidatus Nanohalococcus occultus TaxID=2978047 RepID=UPI0039E0A7D1
MPLRISLGRESGFNDLSGRQKLAVGLVLIIAGLALSGWGYLNYRAQGEAIENAVNTTGTVVSTEIVEDSGGRRSGSDYTPVIRFEYLYSGNSYVSDNMYPPGDTQKEFNSRSSAERLLEKYPEGSEVIRVYIDPEQPGEGFLKKKRSNGPLLLVGIGTVMAFAGLYVLIRP